MTYQSEWHQRWGQQRQTCYLVGLKLKTVVFYHLYLFHTLFLYFSTSFFCFSISFRTATVLSTFYLFLLMHAAHI